MSKTALLQFCDRIRTDAGLEAEVSQALKSDPAAVVGIGAREGFSFTEDELRDARGELADLRASELADDDLDLVTGGGSAPLNNVESTGSVKS